MEITPSQALSGQSDPKAILQCDFISGCEIRFNA